jgi:hypothetical protein
MKKASVVYEDLKKSGDGNEDVEFKANTGRLCRFLSRYGFSLCRKTSVAQQDPERLQISWLLSSQFVAKI